MRFWGCPQFRIYVYESVNVNSQFSWRVSSGFNVTLPNVLRANINPCPGVGLVNTPASSIDMAEQVAPEKLDSSVTLNLALQLVAGVHELPALCGTTKEELSSAMSSLKHVPPTGSKRAVSFHLKADAYTFSPPLPMSI